MNGSGKGVRPDDDGRPYRGGVTISHAASSSLERRRSIRRSSCQTRSSCAPGRSSSSARPRSCRSALLATSCGDDGPGDTARFCTEVQDHTAELTTNPATAGDIEGYLDLYRDIGDVAPLAIEAHWQALVLNLETANTVDMADPESVQRALAQAYATERSAVAVKSFLLANCNVDIGPIATVVPPAPPPPPATTGWPALKVRPGRSRRGGS